MKEAGTWCGVLLALAALAGRAEPRTEAPAAEGSPTVVYEWNPATFRPGPPYQATPVTRPDGRTTLCLTAPGGEWNNYIAVAKGRLKGGQSYTAELRYEIVTPTAFPGTFYMFARSKTLGQHSDIWQTWLGGAGDTGTARVAMDLGPADDWVFYVGCKGPGAQIVDSFRIVTGNGFVMLPADGRPAPADAATVASPATGSRAVVIEPPVAGAGPVLTATDFGLRSDAPGAPATAASNFPALKRAVDACRVQGATRLVIPKGTYRFDSKESLSFSSLTNLVVDGQGSAFVFQKLHPGVAAVTVMACERVVLKDLRLDWDWSVAPLASLCRVVSVSADGLACDLAFPDLNEQETGRVRQAPWMQMFPMDPQTFRLRSSLKLPCAVADASHVTGNVLRVTFKQPPGLEAGGSYCIRHQYYDMSAFRIGDCRHLLFDGVTIHSMPGMGWVARDAMAHWGLRNCRIAPPEGSRRPMSTTADGFHVLESQGDLLIENCEFTRICEDNINIHDNCAQGVVRVDDHTLRLVGNNRWRLRVTAGHAVELFHADYSPIGFRSRVDAVAYEGNDTLLSLAEALPPTLPDHTIVNNADLVTANVRIANCRFNGGGRVLTSARNLTIEDCVFDHTFGQAIQLAVDIVPPHWAEGRPATNVVVRRNRFDSVNRAARVDGAAISMFTRWPAGATRHPLYRDILVEGNRFINPIGPAVSLRNCQGVVLRGNAIDTTILAADGGPLTASVFAAGSSDITVAGNRWETGAAAVKTGVLLDPETTARVTCVGNAVVRP